LIVKKRGRNGGRKHKEVKRAGRTGTTLHHEGKVDGEKKRKPKKNHSREGGATARK